MATATHLVKVWYYVDYSGLENGDIKKVRALELGKWKSLLGDSLENIEVEKQTEG